VEEAGSVSEWIHVRDRDLNHYVIPSAKRTEWREFLDAIDSWRWLVAIREPVQIPEQPEWARMIDRLDGDRIAEELSASGPVQ
jgi:hypothetical protein